MLASGKGRVSFLNCMTPEKLTIHWSAPIPRLAKQHQLDFMREEERKKYNIKSMWEEIEGLRGWEREELMKRMFLY